MLFVRFSVVGVESRAWGLGLWVSGLEDRDLVFIVLPVFQTEG